MKNLIRKIKNLSRIQMHFVWFYLAAFLLSALVLLSCNFWYKNRMTEYAVRSSQNTLQLHINALDTQLENTSSFLSNFLLMDTDHVTLATTDNADECLNAQLSIQNTFAQQLSLYDNISGLLFYAPWSDVFLMKSNLTEPLSDRIAIRDYIKDYYLRTRSAEDAPSILRWFPVSLNGHTFLISIASYEHTYVASWYRIETILSPLTSLKDSEHISYYLSDTKEDSVLYSVDSKVLSSEKVKHSLKSSTAISVTSSENNYALWSYIPRSSLTAGFGNFFIVLLILGSVFVFLILFQALLLQRQVLKPVSVITCGMQSLRQGNFGVTLPVPEIRNEFSDMTVTFNFMSSEIQNLKMKLYEEKLDKARMELDYLTLQIKPHFYLNCLNVIYSLNLSGRTELVSQMTSYLMIYFLYLFKSSSSLVPLQEEMEHIRTYLHIQELRSSSDFTTDFSIDEDAAMHLIPVLSVHTFVENIFKHAASSCDDLEISLEAHMVSENGTNFLHIQIHDNGDGFEEEQLKQLNDMHNPAPKDGKHIGIHNIKHRLLSIYGENARLLFSNHEEGGARIDFWIP